MFLWLMLLDYNDYIEAVDIRARERKEEVEGEEEEEESKKERHGLVCD